MSSRAGEALIIIGMLFALAVILIDRLKLPVPVQIATGQDDTDLPAPTITTAQLYRIAPQGSPEIVRQVAGYSGRIFELCRLTTARRRAHFFAQIAHETAGFTALVEPVTKTCRKYDGGCRYRGRGLIQITHRRNYERYGRAIGRSEITERPDIAARMGVAVRIACAYWRRTGLNRLADLGKIDEISTRINGRGIKKRSLKNRRIFFSRARDAFGVVKLASKKDG